MKADDTLLKNLHPGSLCSPPLSSILFLRLPLPLALGLLLRPGYGTRNAPDAYTRNLVQAGFLIWRKGASYNNFSKMAPECIVFPQISACFWYCY